MRTRLRRRNDQKSKKKGKVTAFEPEPEPEPVVAPPEPEPEPPKEDDSWAAFGYVQSRSYALTLIGDALTSKHPQHESGKEGQENQSQRVLVR